MRRKLARVRSRAFTGCDGGRCPTSLSGHRLKVRGRLSLQRASPHSCRLPDCTSMRGVLHDEFLLQVGDGTTTFRRGAIPRARGRPRRGGASFVSLSTSLRWLLLLDASPPGQQVRWNHTSAPVTFDQLSEVLSACSTVPYHCHPRMRGSHRTQAPD